MYYKISPSPAVFNLTVLTPRLYPTITVLPLTKHLLHSRKHSQSNKVKPEAYSPENVAAVHLLCSSSAAQHQWSHTRIKDKCKRLDVSCRRKGR